MRDAQNERTKFFLIEKPLEPLFINQATKIFPSTPIISSVSLGLWIYRNNSSWLDLAFQFVNSKFPIVKGVTIVGGVRASGYSTKVITNELQERQQTVPVYSMIM